MGRFFLLALLTWAGFGHLFPFLDYERFIGDGARGRAEQHDDLGDRQGKRRWGRR